MTSGKTPIRCRWQIRRFRRGRTGFSTANISSSPIAPIPKRSPAALGLFPHALADVARLPVREVISALHFKADLTLGLGGVAFDYLAK
jgi:hypothetical protein